MDPSSYLRSEVEVKLVSITSVAEEDTTTSQVSTSKTMQ